MTTHSRNYIDTLLHRKRGEYGPLWLFELDPGTWAIVWREWLEDEQTCRLILSEDPNWFNREWSKDGRRPNPTYRTQGEALEEIIRSLRNIKASLEHEDKKQSHYSAYISRAESDLHRPLTGQRIYSRQAHELTVAGTDGISQSPASRETEPSAATRVRTSVEVEETLSSLAPQAAEAKKPWEVASGDPTAVNFRPEPDLHAKMEWVCNNVPRMSRLRILREGAELLCNQLIEKHYR